VVPTRDGPDTSSAAADELGTAEVFAALARSLAELGAMRPTLEQLVTCAVDLVPCDWAAVAAADHLGSQPARHSAGTDEDLMQTVAEIAGSIGTSPGWDAFKRGTVEYSRDLTTEGRYGSYPSEMVARTPIRSVLSFGLRLRDKPLGVLTFYGHVPDAFDECAQTRAALLAEHATIAIDAATAAYRAETLRAALETNRSIGAAIGILVERHKVSPEQAFDLLRVVSQRSNRRLADLADELVRTGHVSAAAHVPASEHVPASDQQGAG
jgi:GAF domain-containing protein